MSDRGYLFLFSVLMIAGGIASAVYLVSGQAATVDGLFLVLTALLTAAVFGLYVKYMISRAMEQAKEAAKPAKAAAPVKAAPVPSKTEA